MFLVCLFEFAFGFFETGSLHNSGCLKTHSVNQASPKLVAPHSVFELGAGNYVDLSILLTEKGRAIQIHFLFLIEESID